MHYGIVQLGFTQTRDEQSVGCREKPIQISIRLANPEQNYKFSFQLICNILNQGLKWNTTHKLCLVA